MTEEFEKAASEAAGFQKIWVETMSKMMQAAFTFTPNSPPPEVMRQIRGGIFQALAASWDEFMRSPQFLDGMRQWMENAITFRKLSNDFMGRVRNETQAPSRGDIDTVMLAVRHMEKRLLDRIDQLSGEVEQLKKTIGQPASRAGVARRGPAKGRSAKPTARGNSANNRRAAP
ncbi:MAG TPA: hypothetical protein VG146_01435 [Verrucomicrobiae bacterium]|nr:hypothetical protein [Verrucomicrobiae bacterium]